MADAAYYRQANDVGIVAAAAMQAGELWQMPDGRAAFLSRVNAAASGDTVRMRAGDQATLTKTAGFVALDGGRAYWDYSANAVYYKRNGDRDFYLGRFVGDATSAATTCVVNLNIPEDLYDLSIADNSYTTVIVGTQALGGLALNRRGGCHNIVISSTNEAQKVDLLGRDTFSKDANAIVEFAFTVPSDGAGTVVDVNVGIADATNATDADSIARHVFMHLDANNVNINFQSKDGTTTVASTDSTIDYTEGQTLATRVEVWIDCRTTTNVKIYVNGSQVLSGTTFRIDNAAAEFRLLAHIEKSVSTDTYEFDLEWLKVRFAEQ